MVISLLLAACAGDPDLTNSIRGIQVVAIEAVPPHPEPSDRLTLKTWVADGIGRGADVLVWPCTPVEGRCIEGHPPGTNGLPLSLWTRVGQADTVFESTNPWPVFIGFADDGLELPGAFSGPNLLVWALACAPGVCPIIDQVAIDPVAGSEAWQAAADMLVDPSRWIEEMPRGQVSLAVKAVAVWLEPTGPRDTGGFVTAPGTGPDLTARNHAPTLAPEALVPDPAYTKFRLSDPDGDPLLVRSFTTAGGVQQTRNGDSELSVLWEPPLLVGREPVRFVVAEDGRGGTAVWCSDPATDPCGHTALTFGSESRPIGRGDPFEMLAVNGAPDDTYFDLSFDLRGTATRHVALSRLEVDGVVVAGDSEELGSGGPDCGVQSFRMGLDVLPDIDVAARCALLGKVGTVVLELIPETSGETVTHEIDVLITGNDTLGCQGI